MNPRTFDRFAARMALLSAAVALAYSLSFAYYVKRSATWAQYTSSGLLMAGGLVGLPVMVAVFRRVRRYDEGFAMVALLVAVASAFGSVLHGAHDVAVFANPEQAPGSPDFPSYTDPRGFATFALFGLGLIVLSALVWATFSKRIGVVGIVTGALTIVVYTGRVTVLDPKRWWVAIAAGAAGVVGVPLWNVLVALHLERSVAVATQPSAPSLRSRSMAVSS